MDIIRKGGHGNYKPESRKSLEMRLLSSKSNSFFKVTAIVSWSKAIETNNLDVERLCPISNDLS